MNTITLFISRLGVVLLVSLPVLAGCTSSGMERSESTTVTMLTVESDIQRIVKQIDATGLSLDNLLNLNQSDTKKAFDRFTTNVDLMESLEKSFNRHAEEMQARGKEYFSEWKKEGAQYSNKEIQNLSDQRRNDLSAVYGRIAGNSTGVKVAFRSYVSDLQQIRTYLSTDLTSKGLDSIGDVTRRVVRDGSDLKYAIQDMQSAIETAKMEMSQLR